MTQESLKKIFKDTSLSRKNLYAIPLKNFSGLIKDELTLVREVSENSILIKSNSKNIELRFDINMINNFKYVY
jgi:hypothetical protein